MRKKKKIEQIRIDFSFKREVFFVVVGAIVGAITFIIPKTIFETQMGIPYYLSWIVFGHIVGVYSSQSIIAGIAIHMTTAISIGIVVGIFLYKTGILIISKFSNGILYGLLAGTAVFVIFYIPVQQLVLTPETARTMVEIESPDMTVNEAAKEISDNFLAVMVGSVITHLVFGVTVGIISSLLSIRFGSRYRCSICNISFSRIDSYQKHIELIHGAEPIKQKRILILGGGFGGVQVLREVQKEFQNDVSIDITLVSKDNFFLFTPMLPEVSSGMIETRHIVTPIRAFCNRARFYAARVESIDIDNKQVTIESPLSSSSIVNTKSSSSSENTTISVAVAPRNEEQNDHLLLSEVTKIQRDYLSYDYLVIALGSETKFFGMSDIEKHAFTIKSWNDAIIIRNHVIHQLEQAELLLRRQPYNVDKSNKDSDLNSNLHLNNKSESLLTFVIVGGGFAGVETAGELNDFLRDAVNDYYHNIESKDIRVIIIQSGNRLLPEMSEELAEFAIKKLIQSGVEVILNTRVIGATANSVKLNNGSTIPTNTIIWSGGVAPNPITEELPCEHDQKSGRIIVNEYLEVQGYPGVFAIGDCTFIIDPNTGNPYPPTAQHAIREGTVVANNIVSLTEGKTRSKKVFDYQTKGMMASIGKRNGVGAILGLEVQGFLAWWIWRMYYLANLPTLQKKLRVMAD